MSSVTAKRSTTTTTDDTRLRFLGDVIPIPPPGGVVLSLGDVVFLVGIGVLVAQATHPLRPGWTRLVNQEGASA